MSSRAAYAAIWLLGALALFGVYATSVPESFNTVRSHRRFFDSDGEFIVRQFRQGKTFTHNDHLLYHVTGRSLHDHFGLEGDPVRSHLALSVFFGTLGVLVLTVAGYWLTKHVALALLASGFVAGSAGWWFFSSTIDTYIPSLAACCLALALALVAMRRPSLEIHAALGAAMGLAFLLRTDSFLLLVLALIFVAPENRRWPYFLATGASGFAVGILGYAALVVIFYDVPMSETASWAMGGFERPEARSNPQWGTWNNLSIPNFATTLVNHVFYTVLLPSLEATRHPRFWESYSVAGLSALAVVATAVIGALGALLWRAATAQRDRLEWRLVAALCLSWLATRVLFYTWWNPFEAFLFAVMSLPALWLALLFGGQAVLERLPTVAARAVFLGSWGVVCAVVWIHNWRTLILPLREISP